GRQAEPRLTTTAFQGPTMGTAYNVKVVSDGPLSSLREAEIARAIDTALEGVNSRMSTYIDDSELSRFNHTKNTDPFAMSRETLDVFEQAIEISRLTDGAFDITIGPLVNAWGFGPDISEGRGLSPEEVEKLRARVGYTKLEIDPVAGTVRKHDPEIYCDLSAIAKGYAVDQVAEALLEKGISDFMVEVGGEVRTGGRNGEGKGWRIGIEHPKMARGVVERIVPLAGMAMATSGDYRNFQELSGAERITHIIDPRSGHPVHHRLTSVTVLRPTCAEADALATAFMVLGPEEGMDLAIREDLAVLLLVRGEGQELEERTSPAFERYLEQVAENTGL
ncbi:MAG: FAD:protein FMN transferase, partial [Thermoanaerobaculia bacterium]|nr:FAD:protein FMN transferase [Thermoanaerobaculia bacterium]